MPLVQAAVNVVVPHPLLEMVGEAVETNDGNTNAIVLVAAKGTFNAKLNDIADGAVITGLAMVNKLCCNKDDTGAAITVDAAVGMATAVMSAASANVTVTVRSIRAGVDVELCPLALVVTPDPTVTSHLVPATRVDVLVAAVNVRVAVVVPEPDDVAAENVVVPH